LITAWLKSVVIGGATAGVSAGEQQCNSRNNSRFKIYGNYSNNSRCKSGLTAMLTAEVKTVVTAVVKQG